MLASFGYDDLGRRTSLTRGNGTVTSYTPDAVSRLGSLTQTFAAASAANNLTLGFVYNPAGQIVSNTRSNDLFAWTGGAAGTTSSEPNGLNQIAKQDGVQFSYDAKGNLLSDGTRSYSYTAENRLASGPSTNLYYDALGRLVHLNGSVTDFLYHGGEFIQELEAHGGPTRRRFVHGPGVDEPLVWYEGAGNNDRRYLHADERGSVVAVSDGTGNVLGVNKYDEYGNPAAGNIGSFGYTGQLWLPELGLWHYKARMYDPRLGRFLQPDPIGYGDGINLYGYVKGDPVNRTDPSGLCYYTWDNIYKGFTDGRVQFLGTENFQSHGCDDRSEGFGGNGGGRGGAGGGGGASDEARTGGPIVVTAQKLAVQYKYVDGVALYKHFMEGKGETVCLTKQQFGQIARTAKPVGRLIKGSRYSRRSVSFYGTDLAYVYGGGTMIYDNESREAVGFYDLYDFDWADRSLAGETATRLGSVGYLFGGTDFEYGYPCQ